MKTYLNRCIVCLISCVIVFLVFKENFALLRKAVPVASIVYGCLLFFVLRQGPSIHSGSDVLRFNMESAKQARQIIAEKKAMFARFAGMNGGRTNENLDVSGEDLLDSIKTPVSEFLFSVIGSIFYINLFSDDLIYKITIDLTSTLKLIGASGAAIFFWGMAAFGVISNISNIKWGGSK